MKKFPIYRQLDKMDCGPSCVRMIAKHYGKYYDLETLRKKSYYTKSGVSLLGISDAAESIGFRTSGVMITFEELVSNEIFPCILHWNQNHFVVCYKVKKTRNGYKIFIADPATGLLEYDEETFKKCWFQHKKDNEDLGVALLLKPKPEFFSLEGEAEVSNRDFSYFVKYLKPYKKQLLQLVLGMVVVSLLQLIFPFLTQSLVDIGIRNSNLAFITLILVSQLVIFVARISVEFIQSWIMLHVNVRINISLVSDFLAKLMKLPLKNFDSKNTGDILQRIDDHSRIESFLTGSSINIVFSFFNFIIFSCVLASYNVFIFLIFLLGNSLYVVWILLFLKKRRELDYKRFTQASKEQNKIIQLITGMQEIKLNNCTRQKRWEWERIQVKLFKISIKGLGLGQMQQVGSVFFSQTTNIVITYIAAKSVISGDMTLGMMMAMTYIIGQLSAPIEQFIGFVRSMQDAKISLERLNEIHGREDEELNVDQKINQLPKDRSIYLKDVSFSYNGSDRDYVLKNINLSIPENKVTAIVGASGSGKTTLIKLMLGFYDPNHGQVLVGNTPLNLINPNLWRENTGTVMQNGYIFSDSIAENISFGDDSVDYSRLQIATETANISDYIESLPLGYNTQIGMEGNGLSQGQCQRILIARAVYKNPNYIFLDEATNSLDANNEKDIMKHLKEFYLGKTVVVVAHRLSTVKDADKIIVLNDGEIVEEGDHSSLAAKKGMYYSLVKNQLELGN